MPDPELRVAREDENRRYVVWVGDELAGYTEIRSDERGRLILPHTVIIPSFRGRGLASVLVRGALEDAAARGEIVVPMCPVVQRYAHEHEVAGLALEWPDPGHG